MGRVASLRGSVSASSGIAFAALGKIVPAMRALGPLTLGALAILIAQQALSGMRIGPVHFTDGSASRLASGAVFILLLVPFQVAVYDFAFRGRRSVADHLRANGVDTLKYGAYALLWYLLQMPISLIDVDHELTAADFVAATVFFCYLVLGWWVGVRLYVVDPVLALRGIPIGLAEAVRATRGHFWQITAAAAIFNAVPIAVLALLSLTVYMIIGKIDESYLTNASLSATISALFDLIFLFTSPLLAAQVYRWLELPIGERISETA